MKDFEELFEDLEDLLEDLKELKDLVGGVRKLIKAGGLELKRFEKV